jgi:hypothetical protein
VTRAVDELQQGRESYLRGSWGDAHQALSSADVADRSWAGIAEHNAARPQGRAALRSVSEGFSRVTLKPSKSFLGLREATVSVTEES